MRIICSAILLVLVFESKAQQIPQYSQWFWNLVAINPAFSGIKPCLEIKSAYRNQWANLDGSPNSGFLTFSVPIYTQRKKFYTPRQGCGFKFESEKIGPFSMNQLNLNYAAHFNFTPDTRLSIGISAGMKQWVFDKNKLTTWDPDPAMQQSNSDVSPTAGFGFWWNGKNYFVNLGFSEVMRSKWDGIGTDSRFRLHTVLNGGYRYAMNERFTLLPYAIFRFPPKGPPSFDLNVIVNYVNKLDIGIGLRNTDAVNAVIQVKLKENFSIGYSFDYVLSKLGRNQFFSHEFTLGFGTCKAKSTSKTICPLF